MIATIDASLSGDRTQPIHALSCVREDTMVSGNDEDIIPFGCSCNSQNIIMITASDRSRKRPQPAKSTNKTNDVVLCGRSVMYLPHVFPWSSCGDFNTKGAFSKSNVTYYGKNAMDGLSIDSNFYQTLGVYQTLWR